MIIKKWVIFFLLTGCICAGCEPDQSVLMGQAADANRIIQIRTEETISPENVVQHKTGEVITAGVNPDELVAFSKTLLGTPYLYGSTDPVKGFDCSGFITYVFNHFNIAVPRSSVDFTDVGTPVDPATARPGDLILFTGTDSTIRVVGHMGIIERNENGRIFFIHSTSGKAYGVTISPLEGYYTTRFVKVTRIFAGNNEV